MKNTGNKLKRDGANLSIWQIGESQADIHPTFKTEEIFDVLIIGGGITGVTTALNLQRAGRKCLLIESRNLGFGTTGGTSAHLNSFLDATYPEIDNAFGPAASKLLADASKEMIEAIKDNIDGLHIDADFHYKAAYLFSQNDKETQLLDDILFSSKQAGIEVEVTSRSGVPLHFQKVLKFSNQAQFHPLKYLNGLAQEFVRLGGEISVGTFIESTAFKENLHLASSSSGDVFRAKNLVWATHIPPGINLLSLRNAPYRSYVLAARLKDEKYPDCLAYDMQEPYHYFRSHQTNGERYLIIGGSDHKTGHGDPEEAFAELEKFAGQYFNIEKIDYRWSSQYYVPVDGLPYIGKFPGGDDRSYVATGFNGNGMIFGSLAGHILPQLILGEETELSQLLSPSRMKPVSGFMEFVKENADVAYHLVADRFKIQAIHSVNELKNGEAKIVEFEDEKLAIYKDEKGKITALSPVCTHAGCIVSWNSQEKSWDCPCHGGRFSVHGHVITGPPRKNLDQVDLSS